MTQDDIDLVIAILNKFQVKFHTLNLPLTTYDELFQILTFNEVDLVHKLCGVTDQTTKELGLIQRSLISPSDDQYSQQFVRVHKVLYKSFEKMKAYVLQKTGQKLSIVSGYRSPAYQTLIFLRELYLAHYDSAQAQTVSKMPLESEHCIFPFHAIDLALHGDNENTKEVNASFGETAAYRCLIDSAPSFGFSLSYPKDNTKNTIYEPWHWLFTG